MFILPVKCYHFVHYKNFKVIYSLSSAVWNETNALHFATVEELEKYVLHRGCHRVRLSLLVKAHAVNEL
jgi:hypothetical protein